MELELSFFLFLFFPSSIFSRFSTTILRAVSRASKQSTVARRPRLLASLRLPGEKFNTGFALAQPRLNFSLVGSANAPLAGSASPAGSANASLAGSDASHH